MNTAIHQELERLLSEPLTSVIERERNTLDCLLENCNRRVVLFGAGGLGRQTLACLRTIGIEPLAFTDNNREIWGREVDGVALLPPELAASRFGAEALFIVAIWNPYHWFSETHQRLRGLGCSQITAPSPVYWKFPEVFLPFYAQDLPQKVYEQSADVLKAADLWSDDHSQQEFLRQVRWRTHGEWNFSRPEDSESYFPADIIRLMSEEVLVDCGAFDGDTIRSFLAKGHDGFQRIFAIEPDAASYAKLESFADGLSPEIKQKINLLHYAVGAEPGVVTFSDGGGLGSHVSESGGTIVQCVPIPALMNRTGAPTYIKMDIEGAEYDALRGARALIERTRPILGICVYHEQRDLWRLPLLMKDMVPEYRMYLRGHEGDGWQTVAYAVPPERAVLTIG